MIKCNLAVLLAERNIKISELSRKTGMSRTTLTALYYNQSKGIQFDTFDALCSYLKCTPNDLFIQEVLEYDFFVDEIKYENSGYKINVMSDIRHKSEIIKDMFLCDVGVQIRDFSSEVESIIITPYYTDRLSKVINSIPVSFKTSIENELMECIKAELSLNLNIDDDTEAHIF